MGSAAAEQHERESGKGERDDGVYKGSGHDQRNRIALFAGEQLGGRHGVRGGARRLVQGKLVAETPGEDTKAQECQSDGKGAQSWSLVTQLGGVWDLHRAL